MLLVLPGISYLSGLESGWIAIGLALGTWANWPFVARRLRIFSQQVDVPGISSNASGDAGQAKTGNVERWIRFGCGNGRFQGVVEETEDSHSTTNYLWLGVLDPDLPTN